MEGACGAGRGGSSAGGGAGDVMEASNMEQGTAPPPAGMRPAWSDVDLDGESLSSGE